MIALATASTTLIEPAPPHTHSHIDLSGSGEAHPRGTPLVQRQGGRGLRKLGGTGWPSHQTDRGGRARAQAGRWQTRAEPAQPQRAGTEPAAVSQEIQLSVAEEGIREVCCARSAVLPKSFCIFSLMRYRSPICCSTPLTKPKQVSHGVDLPRMRSAPGRVLSSLHPLCE
jgi:hypothetical protein